MSGWRTAVVLASAVLGVLPSRSAPPVDPAGGDPPAGRPGELAGGTDPSAPVPGRQERPAGSGLATLLRQAEREAPAVEATREAALAAAEEARAARGTRWGRLDLVGNAGRLNDDTILRPMSRELFADAGAAGFHGLPFDRNQRHWGAELEIPLWLGGILASRVRAADLARIRAAALARGSRWQVRGNAASLWAAAVSLAARREALEGYGRFLDETVRRLELMVRAGRRPRVDLLKVREERAAVTARQAATRAEEERVRALLLALLGRKPGDRLELSPAGDEEVREVLSAPLPGRDELAAEARRVSPVRGAEADAERAAALARAARGARRPHLVARGAWTRHDAPSLPEPLDTWQVGIAVRIPAWSGGSLPARDRAALHRAAAGRQRARSARLAAGARLAASLSRFTAARDSLPAADARVAAAEEAARIERIRYENGAGTVEDLLRAEARLAEARASRVAARAELMAAAEGLSAACERELFPVLAGEREPAGEDR